MRQKLLLSAALISLAAGTAMAQTTSPPASPDTTSSPGMSQSTTGGSQSLAALPSGSLLGSRLSDMSVKNQADETLGEIDDVVIDGQGKIQQVVVSTGGVLGMGGKKVALSWDQVRIDSSRQIAVVNMSQDQLKSMPEFQAPPRERSRDGNAPARSPGGTTGTGGTGGTTSPGGTGTTRP